MQAQRFACLSCLVLLAFAPAAHSQTASAISNSITASLGLTPAVVAAPALATSTVAAIPAATVPAVAATTALPAPVAAAAPAAATTTATAGSAAAAALPVTVTGGSGTTAASSALTTTATNAALTQGGAPVVGSAPNVIPPKGIPKLAIPVVAAINQPKKPKGLSPLAVCKFIVKGSTVTGGTSSTISTAGSNTAAGSANIMCVGAGAPITLAGSGAGAAGFTVNTTGVDFSSVMSQGPQTVLQFTNLNLQIINSDFSDLVGTPYNLIFNNSVVEFVNTKFTGNTGTAEGVLHGYGSFFTFTNCTFSNNHGRQTGVMTIEEGDATFKNCQFLNNLGDQANSGAVTIAQDGVATFTNCIFQGNSGSAGGAILAYQGTTLNIDQCTFDSNLGPETFLRHPQAQNTGGGIQQISGVFSITNSTFTKNVAQQIGGGFATRLADGLIENCDFLNNTAVSGQGGGAYMDTVVADVVNSRFYGNSAFAGGGLFLTSVNGDVSECAFEDNVAANSGGGLAMSQGSGDVAYSVFVNNQVANLGGGLYQNNRTANVHSCIFSENSALQAFSGQGGGIYRNGLRGALTNTYLENNSAALNGGGIFQLDSVGDISTCTFTGNTAVTGQAVYSFDCVSTLSSNGYENEPFNALFLDKSAAFKPSVLING